MVVEFIIDKNVTSGTYTITYDGQNISGDVNLEPSIKDVEVVTGENVSYNESEGVYYLNNCTSTATINVNVLKPADGYALKIGEVQIDLVSGEPNYGCDYSIDSIENFNKTIEVSIQIVKGNAEVGQAKKIKLCRVEPTVTSIDIADAVEDEDNLTYYFGSDFGSDFGSAVTKKTVTINVSDNAEGYTLKFGSKSKPITDNTVPFENFDLSSYLDKNSGIAVAIEKDGKVVYSNIIYVRVAKISIINVSNSVFDQSKKIYYTNSNTVSVSVFVTNPNTYNRYGKFVKQYIYLESNYVETEENKTDYLLNYSFAQNSENKNIPIKVVRRTKKSTTRKGIEATATLYRDTKAPTVQINSVSAVSTDPDTGNTIENPITGNWTNSNTIAVEFTVADSGVGFADDFELIKDDIKANGKTATKIEKIDDSATHYVAQFEGLEDAEKIELSFINLKDALGNANEEAVTINVGIDTVKPVVEEVKVKLADDASVEFVDAKDIPLLFKGDKYTLGIKASDDISGVNDNECVVTLGDETTPTLQKKSDGYYYSEITADDIAKANGSVFIVDNAGNQSEVTDYIIKSQFDSVTVNKTAVKTGDSLEYALNVHDRDAAVINITSFIISVGGSEVDLIHKELVVTPAENPEDPPVETLELRPKTVENGKANFAYRVTGDYDDLTVITVKKIGFFTEANESVVHTMPYSDSNPAKYYAPITLDKYNSAIISVYSNNAVNNNAACDGNELTFVLDTSKVAEGKAHGAQVEDCKLSFSINGGNTWRKVTDNTAILTHNPHFKDMQKILVKAEYKLVDPAGNEAYDADNPEATLVSDIVYYAPINADNVVITCSSDNKKNSAFAKKEDKLSFDANVNTAKNMSEDHSLDFNVTVNDMSGLKASQDNKVAEITKDYEDIGNITFKVEVSDAAGQSFTTEKESNITYYAPITLENVSFTSNARDPRYARNGSNLTFTARASHKVKASNVNVESFAATTVNDETVDLRFEFNGVNGFADQTMLRPTFKLEDAAGNTYIYNANTPEIEYDSTAPKVSIAPKLNGFLNGNFSCTATFADKNLYPEGMKFEYHAKKANATRSAMDTSSFVDKTTIEFKQSLSLSEEDTYKISASVTDKAGNTSADAGMTVTIDKTAPNITSVKITSDTILIFKKGFVISDYVDIEEEFINELICKVSDSTGTVDWDVDKPIETEGKKTISIVVTDMAGNTSSFDFEVYIDATAPAPVVKDTVTGREMEAGKENKFTKELDLSVLLETPRIPNMLQDEFTTLKLLDAEGNEIYDFISKDGLKTDYVYNFTDYGKYVLLVEAKDHAIAKDGNDGNVYGPAKYYITFTDGNIFEVIGDNPILMYSLISLLALALIGGGIFAFIVLAKRKKDKENA